MTPTALTLHRVLETAVGRHAIPVSLHDQTPLLGEIAELDSMAVLAILTGIQDAFGVEIPDDEVGADIFETFGSLRRFVESRLTS